LRRPRPAARKKLLTQGDGPLSFGIPFLIDSALATSCEEAYTVRLLEDNLVRRQQALIMLRDDQQ
jgi:hypothetical protein